MSLLRRVSTTILLFQLWGLTEALFMSLVRQGFLLSFRQMLLPVLYSEIFERGAGLFFILPSAIDRIYFPDFPDRIFLLLNSAIFYGFFGMVSAFLFVVPCSFIHRRMFPQTRWFFNTVSLFVPFASLGISLAVRKHDNISLDPVNLVEYGAAVLAAFLIALIVSLLLPSKEKGITNGGGNVDKQCAGPDNPPESPVPVKVKIFLKNLSLKAPGLIILLILFTIGVILAPHTDDSTFSESPDDPDAGIRNDIILIVLDTLRADHLRFLGYPRNTSPFLDSLASEGALFRSAYSQAPWTTPSLVSLFTGVYPSRHRCDSTYRRGTRDWLFLPELLEVENYYRVGIVSNILAGSKFGFSRGFDVFDDKSVLYEPADRVTDRAIEILENLPENDRPLFFYVLYFDPHMPYHPPPPYDEMFMKGYRGEIEGSYEDKEKIMSDPFSCPDELARMVSLYDGEIAYLDSQLRRLFAFLDENGILDDAWVFITADHGEEIGDHGSLGHAWTLFEEQLWVPLIILPGASEPEREMIFEASRNSDRVELVDVAATILDVAGITDLCEITGKSLLRDESSNRMESTGKQVVAETSRGNIESRMIIHNGFKLIHDSGQGEESLFDLAKDMGESRNIIKENRDVAIALRSLLFERLAEEQLKHSTRKLSKKTRATNPGGLTSEEKDILKSMGYIN